MGLGWSPLGKMELELELVSLAQGPCPPHMSRLFSLGCLLVQPQALAVEEMNLDCLGPEKRKARKKGVGERKTGKPGDVRERRLVPLKAL